VTTAPPRTASPPHPEVRLGLAAMGVAITAWGITGVLIKAIDIDAIALAFWRFLVYALIFTVYVRSRGVRFDLSVMRATLPGGICLAGDVMLFFTAVKHTNVVNATTIGTIHWREVVAALVAIAGVVVIVVESAGTPEWSPGGDLAAVGALFCWSAYWVFAKRAQAVITPMQYTAGTGWWTAIFALPVGLAAGHDMSVPAADQWLALTGLILAGGVLGHAMMNWSIVRVPLWLGSTLTLLIPVLSSIAAWIFLDEPLTAVQVIGMAVVVAALAAIVLSQQTPEAV
jgi:drug/metabolite transporter (DMT)-like permease